MEHEYLDLDYIQELTEMNEHDANNLLFLLKSPDSVIKDWYSKMDKDDHLYAQELLFILREALDNKEIELTIKKRKKFPKVEKILSKFKTV